MLITKKTIKQLKRRLLSLETQKGMVSWPTLDQETIPFFSIEIKELRL